MTRRDDRLALALDAGELPLPETGTIAVFRAGETAIYRTIGTQRFHCQQGLRPVHDGLASLGLRVDSVGPEEAAASIVVATRQRADTFGAVARAMTVVPPEAPVIVTGARTDGIDAVLKEIAGSFSIAGRMAKAHGRVFHILRPAVLPKVVADWEAAFALRANADGFVTGPGMFSPEHVDPGSARLAEHLPGRLKGRIADLGAGWGWLAVQALKGNPEIEEIDLHEAEARALEAARLNVDDPRAAFHWTDVTRLGGERRYDWVITNPPFHQGRAAEPALGAAFIAAAARVLKPNGRLLLVANRSLPYEQHLAQGFRKVTPVAEDVTYKVLEAERPKAK